MNTEPRVRFYRVRLDALLEAMDFATAAIGGHKKVYEQHYAPMLGEQSSGHATPRAPQLRAPGQSLVTVFHTDLT